MSNTFFTGQVGQILHGQLQSEVCMQAESSMQLTMMSTRLASSRSVGFSPKALTSVVMFFLASGRDMARMAGLRGFFRNRKISYAGPQQNVESHK